MRGQPTGQQHFAAAIEEWRRRHCPYRVPEPYQRSEPAPTRAEDAGGRPYGEHERQGDHEEQEAQR